MKTHAVVNKINKNGLSKDETYLANHGEREKQWRKSRNRKKNWSENNQIFCFYFIELVMHNDSKILNKLGPTKPHQTRAVGNQHVFQSRRSTTATIC